MDVWCNLCATHTDPTWTRRENSDSSHWVCTIWEAIYIYSMFMYIVYILYEYVCIRLSVLLTFYRQSVLKLVANQSKYIGWFLNRKIIFQYHERRTNKRYAQNHLMANFFVHVYFWSFFFESIREKVSYLCIWISNFSDSIFIRCDKLQVKMA